MITIIVTSIAVGAALGLGVGWKLGRGWERVRPAKVTTVKAKKQPK